MKLSIVTINYNNAEGLHRTLESVAAQTYRDIEHVIVDGGSNDESVDIIKEYACTSTHPVIWVSEPDKGIYNGMNKGIEIAQGRRVVNALNRSELVEDKNKGLRKATGDYVWILNSGDCAAAPDVVERMIFAINSLNINSLNVTENVPILLGNIIHVYPGGKKKRDGVQCKVYCVEPQPMDVSMLTFYSGTVPHDAAFVRRELFEKFGYFDEKMKICADWKLYLDMVALSGVQPWYVDIDVVLFDMSGISNTQNERRLAERRAYLEQVLPTAVLKDYDAYAFPIRQYQRLKRHHLWGLVYFLERVLFKFEKWGILR